MDIEVSDVSSNISNGRVFVFYKTCESFDMTVSIYVYLTSSTSPGISNKSSQRSETSFPLTPRRPVQPTDFGTSMDCYYPDFRLNYERRKEVGKDETS